MSREVAGGQRAGPAGAAGRQRIRILITNDDGVDSPGIIALARAAVERGALVVVAAPHKEVSGASAAMSAMEDDGHMVLQPRRLDGLAGVPSYAVAASPAFITMMGLRGTFGPPPDVVLSGVNRGANAGSAVLHSGTVGAAMTAAQVGCRAIAVSLDVLPAGSASVASGGAAVSPGGIAALVAEGEADRNWDTAAQLAVELLPNLLTTPPGTVLNLNVPDAPRDGLKGMRRAKLAKFGQVQMTVTERGERHVRLALVQPDAPLEQGTDLALLSHGYATVTPLRRVAEAQDVRLAWISQLPL